MSPPQQQQQQLGPLLDQNQKANVCVETVNEKKSSSTQIV